MKFNKLLDQRVNGITTSLGASSLYPVISLFGLSNSKYFSSVYSKSSYDGSIMTMVYDNRPATEDIDCVFSEINLKLLENILNLTKSTFSLSEGWINEEIKEPLKSILKEDKETYRTYSNLRILKPRAEQLLAMKILAARPEPSKDFIDAYILLFTKT